jgi:hypothetical protein
MYYRKCLQSFSEHMGCLKYSLNMPERTRRSQSSPAAPRSHATFGRHTTMHLHIPSRVSPAALRQQRIWQFNVATQLLVHVCHCLFFIGNGSTLENRGGYLQRIGLLLLNRPADILGLTVLSCFFHHRHTSHSKAMSDDSLSWYVASLWNAHIYCGPRWHTRFGPSASAHDPSSSFEHVHV